MDAALAFWARGQSSTTYGRALVWQLCRASMQLNMGLLIHGCTLDKFKQLGVFANLAATTSAQMLADLLKLLRT